MRQEKQIIEEYEINPYTMAVLPINYGSRTYSKIIEIEDECVSPFKPLYIVKVSCEFFGVTYEGLRNGTKKLIGANHKVPIAICPVNNIYFFPTSSPDNTMKCAWIGYEHILDFRKGRNGKTIVFFKNNLELEIDISLSSFQNQMIRTVMLKSKLSQRLEETRKKVPYRSNVRVMESLEKYRDYRFY